MGGRQKGCKMPPVGELFDFCLQRTPPGRSSETRVGWTRDPLRNYTLFFFQGAGALMTYDSLVLCCLHNTHTPVSKTASVPCCPPLTLAPTGHRVRHFAGKHPTLPQPGSREPVAPPSPETPSMTQRIKFSISSLTVS